MLAFSLATSPIVGEMKEEHSVYSLVEGPEQKKIIIGLMFKNVLLFLYVLIRMKCAFRLLLKAAEWK